MQLVTLLFSDEQAAELDQRLAGKVPDSRIAPTDSGPDAVDLFVQRCIGTVLELERHQASGGVTVLVSPDGTLRTLTIDANRDGGPLPGAPLPEKVVRAIRKTARPRGGSFEL